MGDTDEFFMGLALEQARRAAELGEVPVGAVAVWDGTLTAAAHNRRECDRNALSHAETLCIMAACHKLGGWRLHRCTLYVTLEPCLMCAGAIIGARIPRVVFGAADPKGGAFGSVIHLGQLPYHYKPEIVSGVREAECSELLQRFFRELRAGSDAPPQPLERDVTPFGRE